ncbi:hypothetical protein AB0L85_03860 [Streptomyces sp. NPDC052051]|uniref:hypothetical protein n=1 Tax=Streptomyces sp. NPDC052051 TaxID=3154649 RepID=UPI003421719A
MTGPADPAVFEAAVFFVAGRAAGFFRAAPDASMAAAFLAGAFSAAAGLRPRTAPATAVPFTSVGRCAPCAVVPVDARAPPDPPGGRCTAVFFATMAAAP